MIKKGLWMVAIMVVGCLLYSFTVPTAAQKQPPTVPPVIKTVVIDPGHGGMFAGTTGLISKEKDVNLAISLKLGQAFEKEFPEIKIVFTRTSDVCSGNANNLRDDLSNRARIANEARGDMFISIHCNATRAPAGGHYEKKVVGHENKTIWVGKGKNRKKKVVKSPIYESYYVKNTRVGTETYIWAADRSGKKGEAIGQYDEGETNTVDSLMEASAFNLNSPEARIRTQLYVKKYFTNSAMLAKLVEEEFVKSGRKSYGVKQRDVGIQVLQATGMPSILVETGFLSNKEEEIYLNSPEGEDEVVQNIIDAFKRYKLYVEGKGLQ